MPGFLERYQALIGSLAGVLLGIFGTLLIQHLNDNANAPSLIVECSEIIYSSPKTQVIPKKVAWLYKYGSGSGIFVDHGQEPGVVLHLTNGHTIHYPDSLPEILHKCSLINRGGRPAFAVTLNVMAGFNGSDLGFRGPIEIPITDLPPNAPYDFLIANLDQNQGVVVIWNLVKYMSSISDKESVWHELSPASTRMFNIPGYLPRRNTRLFQLVPP